MISDQEIERVAERSSTFKRAILNCRYDRDRDRVELVTTWCTIIVDRNHIAEFRAVSAPEMETIFVSDTGLHVRARDIDINAAGLITDLAQRLEREVVNSF